MGPAMGVVGLGCHDPYACLQMLSTAAVEMLWMIRKVIRESRT
jgi:hypothetical protein